MVYRAEIDGLRALAVLAVVFYHAGFVPFSGGYVGVDVFFVVSGYLITSLLLLELQGNRFSIARFYERRARRILPALALVMVASIPFAWVLMLPRDFLDFTESVAATSLFSSNVLFWSESGYFETAAELKPLIHTWSLAIEEQFYIAYPVLLLFCWRYARAYIGWILLGLLVVSLGVAEYFSSRSPSANFYLLPPRGWELLVGAYLAYEERTGGIRKGGRAASIMGALGLLAIAAAVFGFDADTAHPSLITLVPVLGTALVIRYGCAPGIANTLLTRKLVVGVGLISYSLYLWHQPVFVFARFTSMSEPSPAVFLALSLLSIAIAALSYRFVERPFRDRRRTSKNLVWTFSASATAALLTFSTIGIVTSGLPSRIPQEQLTVAQTRFRNGSAFQFVDGRACTNRELDASCVLGDPGSDPSWALVGDSHASMFGPSLDAAFSSRGIAALQMTYAGCPYALGMQVGGVNNIGCPARNAAVREVLLESGVQNVVIAGRYVLYYHGEGFDNGEGGVERGDDAWLEPIAAVGEQKRRALVLESYRESIAELLDAGLTVYLIYPVPEMGWDIPRHWFKRARVGIDEPISVDMGLYHARSREVIDAFDALGDRANLVRIIPARLMCDTAIKGRCVSEIGGQILYDDDDHLSRAGTDLVIDELVREIEKALPRYLSGQLR